MAVRRALRAWTLDAESPSCAGAARDMVGSYRRTWGLPYAVDAARLVAAALRAERDGLMTYPEILVIGVSDEDSAPPELPPGEFVSPGAADDFAEALLPDRGRGLLIAQRPAESVWWSPGISGGRTV